ncbi:hypothetical protein NLJ89_g9116 [Agrocybe chaxingu]|uniref:Uncharacterized protein n=1 Tax=Agrocybe chaxingu TaxID=84603 RepID=A0A9W8MQ63_9AGAR|nr:hypothetical protein NLJ89_g9116 [Agrocybe chaxingu]
MRIPYAFTSFYSSIYARFFNPIPSSLSLVFTPVSPWSNPAADRLIATKEEVINLRNRFEAELERQAAKAARLAAAASNGNKSLVKGGRTKRERQERDRERAARLEIQRQQRLAKAITAGPAANTGVQTPTESVESAPLSAADALATPTGAGGGKTKSKKKKRSALANASNPHHLRNYVPPDSRTAPRAIVMRQPSTLRTPSRLCPSSS